jgi:hypothetical protein
VHVGAPIAFNTATYIVEIAESFAKAVVLFARDVSSFAIIGLLRLSDFCWLRLLKKIE